METIKQHKISIKEVLFNPFIYIAGAPSLLYGLIGMVFCGTVGYINSVHFDGVLDLHFGQTAPFAVFLIELVLNWLLLSIILLILGNVLSKSKIRWIDVFGTQAMARWPMCILVSLTFIPVMRNFSFSNPITILFGLASLLIIIWMVALMYNAYRISCNLKGAKLIVSFIGGLISAEVFSKIIILKVVFVLFSQVAIGKEVAESPYQVGEIDKETIALSILGNFKEETYTQIPEYFDDKMKAALPEKKLEQVWNSLNTQVGKYQKSSTVTNSNIQTIDVVYILCHFEKMNLKMKVVFNEKNQVAGLFFVPENQQ